MRRIRAVSRSDTSAEPSGKNAMPQGLVKSWVIVRWDSTFTVEAAEDAGAPDAMSASDTAVTKTVRICPVCVRSRPSAPAPVAASVEGETRRGVAPTTDAATGEKGCRLEAGGLLDEIGERRSAGRSEVHAVGDEVFALAVRDVVPIGQDHVRVVRDYVVDYPIIRFLP